MITRTPKEKSQAWLRLASVDDLSVMLPSTRRHSTRSNVGRKQDVHGQCPVCNSRRYLGKQLALILDGNQHRAAVCEGCHAAASASAAYSLTIAHRIAQTQHHCAVKKEFTPC